METEPHATIVLQTSEALREGKEKNMPVAHVTGRTPGAGIAIPKGMAGPLAAMALKTAFSVPWEAIFAGGSLVGSGALNTQRATRAATPKSKIKANKWTPGPGCLAADNALLTLGYLEGLSRGNQGFGVLAMGRDRLEEGAQAAATAGDQRLAQRMHQVAATLPQVHDQESAQKAAEALKPLTDEAWVLARACKTSHEKVRLNKEEEPLTMMNKEEEPLTMVEWAGTARTDDLCNACAVPSAAEFYMDELAEIGRQDLALELSELNLANEGDSLQLARALDTMKDRVPQISDALRRIDLEVQRSMRE